MNRFLLKGLAVPLILLCGCADDSPLMISPDSIEIRPVTLSAQRRSIERYIGQNRKLTRSEDYYIIPYIEKGDTLLYVVEYGEGWEIFSNSFNMPMSLIKSDTGSFTEAMTNPSPGFRFLYDQILNTLRADKATSNSQAVTGSEEWIPFIASPASSTPTPTNPPETAVYTLVGQKEIYNNNTTVPHLIATHWHQNNPLNNFMPFQLYEPDKHTVVGCNAVTIGQLLYYSHYKWGLQTSIPSIATYNPQANEYLFSNFSTDRYSQMYTYYFSTWDGDAAPIFLAWIAKEIESTAKYQEKLHIGTESYLSKASDFYKKKTGYNVTFKDYNKQEAANMVLSGRPVPLSLNEGKSGHSVIIDALDKTESNIDYYYAYVTPGSDSGNPGTDPTMPSGPTTSPGSDYDSLVARYGQIYTENHSIFYISFRFNWGWGGKNDDLWINGNIINTTFTDLAGETLNHTYTLHKMISYSPN